jgi:hypothetical protein
MHRAIFVDLIVFAASRPKYQTPKRLSTLKIFDLKTFSGLNLVCKVARSVVYKSILGSILLTHWCNNLGSTLTKKITMLHLSGVSSTLYLNKISTNLLAKKLHVEWWWKWPLILKKLEWSNKWRQTKISSTNSTCYDLK